MLKRSLLAALIALPVWAAAPAQAQNSISPSITASSNNRPLSSLRAAAAASRTNAPTRFATPYEVPNFVGPGAPIQNLAPNATIPNLQAQIGLAPVTINGGFPGASNDDNAAVAGGRIAPPDTDGDVGPNHYVQMINLVTTIYDKSGGVVVAPFTSNAFWQGIGGNCQTLNRGDPIVLYDEVADRWFVSQFAFPNSFATFSQCVAVSVTGDPTGAYNRYEFSFTGIGFNDYPKHGIVDDSITIMANLFTPPGFAFGGTYLGVMDKNAMYAGQPATMVGANIGTGEFGFVAADRDGPGAVGALFATAMSRTNLFDIWELDIDWNNPGAATLSRIAGIPISAYDNFLCAAPRGACVPQPTPGGALESLSDRLMHRLQIRDFGAYRSMVAAHTVDVGSGRAGIRWYEMRETGGTWSLYQEGTYGPNDGLNRFMPSIAMNAAGDIGLGYLLSSSTTFVSTAVAGQSAGNTGTGQLDGEEVICAAGGGAQTGTARAGDYSATAVDPVSDTFWHTNEVFNTTGNFNWDTFICEFSVPSSASGAAQFGTERRNQADASTFYTVPLASGLSNPIVVMGPPSFAGAQPTNIRVNNVTASNFQYQLDEWDYLDGSHITENTGWLALDAGSTTIGSLDAVAGTVNINQNWTTVTFSSAFSAAPVVVAQVATRNGGQSVTTRIRNVTATSFQVRLQEEEGNDGTHVVETVHFIAMEPGTTTVGGTRYVVGRTGNTVTDAFSTISFGTTVNAPNLVAQMQTFDGADTADLRHQNLTPTSVQIKVEEETSANAEVGHTTEVIGYIVVGSAP